MKNKLFIAFLSLITFAIAGAPAVAMITGMTIATSALTIGAGVLSLSLLIGPAQPGFLFVNSPDVSAITTALVQFGGEVMRKHVNAMEIAGDSFFKFYRNLHQPVVLPRLASAGNIRPYRKQADITGNEPTFTDRTLTARAGKWDFDIDFEEFRNTYLASGETKPFFQVMLDKYSEDFWAQINDDVAYLGNYNSAGSTAAAVADGWGTLIADEITATNLTEVTTGSVSANGIEAVDSLISAMPSWMRNKLGTTILCSYDTFDLYAQDYRTSHGYSFQPRAVNEYMVDNTNVKIKACSFMGSSQRLIATVPGNLAWGTDGNNLKMYATETRNIIEVRALGAIGFQIADLDALLVSDVA